MDTTRDKKINFTRNPVPVMAKIFLVGYMGCGKSTYGKKLASVLGLEFVDMDYAIEVEEGRSISEIFEKEGEEKFREREKEFLKKLLKRDNLVVSSGGGAPCFFNNMQLMNENGISVYFKMSVDSLVNRLINAKQKRPLIQNMNESDLHDFIKESLTKREPFYNLAHFKVKAKDLKVDELAEFLKKEIHSR